MKYQTEFLVYGSGMDLLGGGGLRGVHPPQLWLGGYRGGWKIWKMSIIKKKKGQIIESYLSNTANT